MSVLVLIIIIGSVGLANYANSSKNTDTNIPATPTTVQAQTNQPSESPVDKNQTKTIQSSQDQQLLYLIEEEKLAHDVYTYLYNIYGARVFGNILKSEQTHQSKVLVLLQSRNIADPRSDQEGVFKNQDLQNLYNNLIAQGKISETEAYKVGVAIEELDIKDITNQLATAIDSDVIAALNSLRDGSENHLRAFNRQLGK